MSVPMRRREKEPLLRGGPGREGQVQGMLGQPVGESGDNEEGDYFAEEGVEGASSFLEQRLRMLLLEIEAANRDLQTTIQHAPHQHGNHHGPRKEKLGRNVTGKLFILTLVWQVLNIGIITFIDMRIERDFSNSPIQSKAFEAGIAIMMLFQATHMVFIVMSSVKLAKQVLHHTASSSFLVQSYLSTILLFAGIYTLIHRMHRGAWSGVTEVEKLTSSTYTLDTFTRMLYFSVATMTGTGFGDIHPKAWYLYLLVCCEMLLSVVYTTTIFARGLTVLGGPTIPKPETARHTLGAGLRARTNTMPAGVI